jgi:hypothetical protein
MALAVSLFAAPARAASLTEAQIQGIISFIQSFGVDAATVANVEASLRGQAPGPSMPSSSSCTFTRDLTIGSTGADVTCLQQALVAGGYLTMPTGVAMGYFGTLTQAAVSKWQAAAGVSPTAGYFGPKSRAAFGLGGGPTSGGPTTPVAPGTGLMISAGSQPANALAPEGASRVAFTKFILTAGNDGDVTVNSLTVQRVGLGSNGAFAGVILVDQDNNQLGTAKTFNSNDQATIGTKVIIPRGQSRTFTVAGNMAASLDAYSGEAPGISVVAVNTSATVTGSLPIVGAYHTMNATLVVGTLSLDVSNAFAANSPVTKEIGTTAFKVSGFRVTAGSAEDVRLKSITYNQTGSASAINDLANIMVVVGSQSYPVTVSADGKYVMANFGSGVLIPSGDNVDVYVTYDIIGSNSANRTVIFDVDKTTDIYAEGVTYGYGVSPGVGSTAVSSLTHASSNTTETSGTPYIYGNQVTVSGASVTTVQKNNTVGAAQNIAINVPNQPLGSFDTDIKGEALTAQSLLFSVASTTGSGYGLLTNVTLVNENGTTLAGPVDGEYSSALVQTLTFSDSVTLLTGKHTYTLRGKVASTINNGGTYITSTNPSSGWSNVKGDVTGNSFTFSQGNFAMNTMTVKSGAVAIGRAASPASQTMVAGSTNVLMANFQFDATQSGEDARFATAAVQLAVTGGAGFYGDPDYLTNCSLFDGNTALNTGSNVLNPTATATSSATNSTITLDNPVTVAKGTVKTLGMRCNIDASTPGSSEFLWDVQAAGSAWTFTGAVSNTNITETDASDSAVVVTVGTGSVTVSIDASSPGYKLVSGGTSGVTIGAMKFRAANEALNLQKLGLKLTNSASSSSGDLVKVSIYDGSTLVGDAYFTGSNTTATSTLNQIVVLPKDTDKTLTLKADFANVGTAQAVTFSGHLVAVDYLNAEGVGAESGLTRQIAAGAGSTAVAGARVFKSFPTVAIDSLPSTGIADGRLMRFKVTADSKGPIGLTELNFIFATTTASVTSVNVYAYEDANYSNAVSGLGSGGMFGTTFAGLPTNGNNVELTAFNGSASTTLQIPAGGTRYFEVRGTVAGSAAGASITATLRGASTFVTDITSAATTNPLATSTSDKFGNDFIWSPNSTTTAVRADQDWTGGYGVSGLPSNGLINTRSN